MKFQRYAVFYTFPQGKLADFGADWLGWNIRTGQTCPHPRIARLPVPVEALTAAPRKYGFHGTVKPPFTLAEGTTLAALRADLAALAPTLPPVTQEGLALSRMGHFLALCPTGDQAALRDMAARVVAGLDHFRRPATEAELARRRKTRLSPEQDALLLKWGYPHVMEAFRFHVTLTGRLDPAQADLVQEVLGPLLRPLLPTPLKIDSLTLVGQDPSGWFHKIERVALTG